MANNFLQSFEKGQLLGLRAQEAQRQNKLRQALQQGDFQTAMAIDPQTTTGIMQEQRLQQQQQMKAQQQAQQQRQAKAKNLAGQALMFHRMIKGADTQEEARLLLDRMGPEVAKAFNIDPQEVANMSVDEFIEEGQLAEPKLKSFLFADLPAEVKAKLIGEGSDKQTSRQRQIRELEQRGFDTDTAQDIASGRLEVEKDDFGNLIAVNPLTGEVLSRTSLREGGQQPSGGQQQPRQQPSIEEPRQFIAPEDTEIGQAALQGTGPVATGKAFLSNLFGGVLPGQQFGETQESRQKLRIFNQAIKTGFVNNPKFPVAEQKIVSGFLPDPDQIFQDPETTASNIGNLREFLNQKLQSNQRTIQEGNVTSDKISQLSDQNAELKRLLEMINNPSQVSEQAQGGDDLDAQLQQLEQRERELQQKLRQ